MRRGFPPPRPDNAGGGTGAAAPRRLDRRTAWCPPEGAAPEATEGLRLQGGSHLLREALRGVTFPPGARGLDICAGTGALALTAARLEAAEVWAVDIFAHAALAVRRDAWLHRQPIRVVHTPVADST